jgi:hydroxypyruvate isomerase
MNRQSIEKQEFPAPLSRRSLLKRIGGGALGLGAMAALPNLVFSEPPAGLYQVQNRRVRQSVVLWCYKPMPVDELAVHAAGMGLTSVELVLPEFWPVLKKSGLTCAIAPSHGFAKGFARPEEHDECVEILTERINQAANAGVPNVITFSGFRRGLSDEAARKNTIEGLKKIVGLAEKKKVTLCLEMLNSRVHAEMRGHPDYFCDNLDATVEICRQISSERMKVLFDIYHVQIMHGDLISRIQHDHPYFAHYHTGGNPGRNEIDASQEINYPAVMDAIAKTGYQGYVGHEFIPTRDKTLALNEAVRICDV